MTDDSKTDFSKTLRLPQTDFPMRAGLPVQEPKWVQRWLDEGLYQKLREKRKDAPKFILHLGPPYANGNFHMGHALTYVLKDFIVRSKGMAGFDSPYVPGWDCHGLPIEWKIEQELREKKQTKNDISKKELRARCRAYAQKWVDVQKAEWQRLGALADWDKPYLTMNAANEAGIAAELGKMVQRGLVYRGLRPTLWSWAEETALAEAEVEYADKESIEVYVALPIVGRDNEYLVIWTTTPWTLPANRAVAVKGDEKYIKVQIGESTDISEHIGKVVWVADNLLEKFAQKIGFQPKFEDEITQRFTLGKDMVGWKVRHPLYDRDGPVVDGFHVTTDSGTGAVHIAPSHGQEDFQIGVEHNLDLACPVEGDGKYGADVPALPKTGVAIAGKLIWPAQKDIIAELEAKGWLMKQDKLKHSYPVSWRSKEKLIYRTTHQWFVDLDKKLPQLDGKSVREESLNRIFGRNGEKGVEWVPAYGANRIGSMIENRPDWCISRQRAWGVPITIIELRKAMADDIAGICDGLVVDEGVWNHLTALVSKEGIDAWDDRLGGREAELFPDGWLESRGLKASDFAYTRDILDVWFDSGTTHAHVLRADPERFGRDDGKRPADLYQEGSDQHRGWFHSSLLTSVANYGDAPYEQVVTSGFVVDGEGRKFSKSLGNGVEPRQLLEKYGMDIIRLWVASSDYSEDIRYSPTIMEGMSEAYRRFRNTFRWLLGNLHGFDAQKDAVPYEKLPELEQYILHRLHNVLTEVREHFETYQFHKAYRALYEFCGGDLSNFYFDVRKDVLYCDPANSAERLGCLTVLDILLRGLVTHLAPVIPFTADEVWRAYGNEESVHLSTFMPVEKVWISKKGDFHQKWNLILQARSAVNLQIEKLRAEGHVGSNLEVEIKKLVVPDFFQLDEQTNRMLSLVCGISDIRVIEGANKVQVGAFIGEGDLGKHPGHKCPRCWRYYDNLVASGVCARCDEAMKEIG